ncbi:hypothetical protein KAH27_07470 [bacterium]|nr:hypothetical protein [bacterium]
MDLPAPVTTAASDIGDNDFDANWNAVSGATSYRLDVATNDYPIAANLDISGYKVYQYDSSQTYTIPASTTVSPGGYVVIGRNVTKSSFETAWGVTLSADTVYINSGNTMPQINGGETYRLANASLVTIDAQSGEALNSRNTVQRNNTTDNPTLSTSWTESDDSNANPGSGANGDGTAGLVINEYSDAAAYANEFVELYYDAPAAKTYYVSGYSNKTVNAVYETVSGLDANSDYYYRVRAFSTTSTSTNSGIIEVTTTPEPALFGFIGLALLFFHRK